jgi:hypothetical protein
LSDERGLPPEESNAMTPPAAEAGSGQGSSRRRFIRTSIAVTAGVTAASYTKPSLRSFGVPAALAVSGPLNGGGGGGDGGGDDDGGPPVLTCADCPTGSLLYDNLCQVCRPGFRVVGGICIPRTWTDCPAGACSNCVGILHDDGTCSPCRPGFMVVGGICIPQVFAEC